MNCFSCHPRSFRDRDDDHDRRLTKSEHGSRRSSFFSGRQDEVGSQKRKFGRSFTLRELSKATRNFKEVNMIGEGGFGKVFKGVLDSGQVVAIKQLNLDGLQGNQEFIVEVLMLSLLHHPNLVTLTGYCSSRNQRLLVYEYMPNGCLEDHLFDLEPEKEPLSWSKRMKIAIGSAQGLEYLHCKANPPVIYRDLKSANILLDENFNPKLSDFGLAKLGPTGDKTHVSTRVMGTYGYCAPDYVLSGKLTIKSDIYSFGVVLLELISGRKVIDFSKKPGDQNLLVWSRPLLRDKKKFIQLIDPALQGRFPIRSLYQVIAIAAMCLNDQPSCRPVAGDVVVALEYVESQLRDQLQMTVLCSPSTQSPSHLQRDKDSIHRSQTFGSFTSV